MTIMIEMDDMTHIGQRLLLEVPSGPTKNTVQGEYSVAKHKTSTAGEAISIITVKTRKFTRSRARWIMASCNIVGRTLSDIHVVEQCLL